MAQPHNGQKRTSGVPRITRAGTWLHWLGMLAMVVGLFAPLATVDATATVMTPEQSLMKAAQQPFDRDTADFQRVVLVGNFQHQLGCGDWDTNCDQSRLVNINGFWTGVFGIPPGTWDWELVAIDRFGTQYAVDDGQVSVADGQSGIYSEFDSASRSSNVWAVTQVAYANGSFGDVALAQDGDGYVATALNIANDGWVDMQVTVGGESLTTGADFRQGVSRVTFDSSGSITNVEHRGFAEITVERVDADGNPLGNSCFVLEGSSQSRACDTDGSQDGNANGSTVLRFPAGFQPGGYTLRETRAADGAEQLSDQQIDVQPGQATIQARSEGEPTPETGDLVVLRQDANGAPVGGACFEIINANGEVVAGACDEDGDVADDGRIGLLGVPAGDYTLSETRTPDGYEPATDVLVSVFPNQVTEQGVFSNAVPVDDPEPIETEEPTEEATEEATEEPTEEATEEATEEPTEEATEEPTEEVTQAPAVGRIIVYRQDDAGNPVGGSCFEVIDNNGQIVGDACDEDGIAADDGTTGIENIPTGTYNLVESRVPEGHEQAQDTQVTVNEGDNIYDVFAPAIPVTEEPTEEATEEATEEPTEEATEEATEEPTEEATEVPTEPVVVGRIVVYREDGQGNRVGGSCFEARDADGEVVGANCDEDGIAPDDGSIGVVDMPAGDFTLVETRIPDGYEQVPDTQVTVVQGDAIYTVFAPALPEDEVPTEEATEEPTEEATEEPTEEPTEEAPPAEDGAALSVTYDVDDSQPLACIELDTTGAIGMMELPYACDNGANDENPEAGTIEMQSLDAGDFVVVPFEGPESVVQADPQPVTLVEGETAAVTFDSEEPAVTSFVVETTDGADPVAGACYVLDEQGDVLCDNDGAGVTFNDVLPGEHDVRMTDAPDGYSVSDSDRQLVAVAEDGSTVATFQVVLNTTSLVIRTTDGSATVGGACYQIDDDEPVCDDGSGVLTVSGITPGQHTVSMASAPAGFENAPEQTVEVAADSSSEVTFAVERSTTSFVINTTDGTNPVGGACYSLPFAGPFCDDGTGSLTVTDVPPLDVEVQMSSAPDGYEAANPQTVSIAADGSTVVTFEVNRITVDIVVNTVDESTGESLGGACYRLDDGDVQCDEDASGQVVFEGEVPGEKTLSMDTAPAGFEPAEDQIIAADVSNIEVGLQQTNGNIVVTITDGTNPLAGACVQLGSEEPVCDGADGDGSITFADLAADSEQTVTITSAPDGYDLPEEGARSQTVTVLADEDNPVQFVLSETPPATGSIVVTVTDGTNPLPGACVQLGSEEPVCDGVDGDGTITFADLAADSEQTVTITSAPEGYDLPEEGARSQTATVVSDTDTPVEFVLSETPPATGTLDVTVLFSDETSAANVCVIVTQVSGGDATATECDTDGDGVVNFAELPEGSYSVTLDESQYDGPAIETVVPVTGTVEAGAANTATLYLTLLPTTGTLEVSVLSSGSPVAGACLTVGGNTICDGGAGDTDGTANGVVVVAGLDPTENLVVAMSTVPSGYQQPADQTASISAGDTTSLEFNLVAEVLPGSVTVQTVDGDGEPLTNACYRLVQGSTVFGPRCDVDPADGQIVFEDVPAGTYRLEQTRTPSNQFQTAPSQNVTVNAGEDTTVEITMDLRPGQLRITTLDRDDQSIVLQGACFMLVSDSELGPFCDANDGNSDGIVRFSNVPAGQYELRQTVATAGYETAPNRNVTINAGGNTQITVLNSRVQPPAESGTLVVIPLAPNGEPVPGGCYQVFNGDTPVTNRICDNADDQPARITIENLPVGELTLRETLAPSPDWQIAADITVTIRNGETTTVEVPHQYKRGHVVIQAVNSVGLPLQGACFTLTDAGDMEICTDSTGQATVSGLEPGTRQLTQTKAPFGFKLNETPREVIVRPGQTTTVRVVFENEPPPNTGTVQIQKFFCPAGEEGERTRFLGGAQGNQELKQTAGCEPGVARFTLVAEDGSTESNAEFSTNEEGRAQLTAVEGIYLLTETDPDLPGNSSARLRVGTGQMTTVIVINYVAPPAPAPVTINVEGYTCAPGFSGSSFADFQASCMAQSQLTNQITVRAEAGNRYKRVTGDGGVVGKTSFVELPAGNYTIWSERPHSIPVTYLFCGADVNAPTLKAVNGSVSISLESGSTILCRVFQVPPLFDAEHGAIQVHKFNCPINERQRGYDYQNECSRPTEPIAFEIVMLAKTDGTTPEPVRVSTNGDGIVQFPMLVPGTYKLTEVEGEWCFAQSNSVDAEGNVVVHKNKLSEVWVYNCVGTKSPPNTGSGDAAGLTGGDGGIAPMQVLPNLLWPTVMLAGWIVWRDRRQA